MPTDRYIITDRQLEKIEPHCLGKKSDPGRTGGDARLFLEAVFWIARTGAQWRDLPGEFGKWNSVCRRFRDWGVAGVFERIFNALSDEPDMEMAMIDVEPLERHRFESQWRGIVKVHRHGQGSKGGLKVRR